MVLGEWNRAQEDGTEQIIGVDQIILHDGFDYGGDQASTSSITAPYGSL